MKCEDIKELLTEYLDGELPADDAAAVEEHTAGCGACRAELDALRQTAALLKSLPKADAPVGLAQNVTALLDREVVHRRAALMRWMHVGGWLSAAAAVIIVIQLLPWQPPRESAAPSRPVTVEPEEYAEEDSAPADAERRARPGPPPGALKKETMSKRAESKTAEKSSVGGDTVQTIAEVDDADAEGAAVKPGGPGLRAAARRSVPANKGAEVTADAVRAAVARGKVAVKEKSPGIAYAKAKAEVPLEEKGGVILGATGYARARKRPAPLTLTYACSDVKAGRAAVLKALTALQGATFEQDAKLAFSAKEMANAKAGNVIDARVPREKLPALVAALKLAGWSPPKDAGEKAKSDADVQLPDAGRFGGKTAPEPNAVAPRRADDARATVALRQAATGAGEQAKAQQDIKEGAQATFADTAQQAPPTVSIRIILKVKPSE